MKRSLLVVTVLVALSACSIPQPATSPGTIVATSPATDAASQTASGATFTADAGGLRLEAALDRTTVEAGGAVSIALSLVNDRPDPVTFEEPCHGNSMSVDLRVPLDPPGRDWDGLAGAFKAYALEHGQGTPMESSTRDPLPVFARDEACHAQPGDPATAGPSAATIPAGETYETVLTWSAQLVNGVPAEPGEVPFSIRVLYDQQALAGGMTQAETLEVTGSISIVDGQPGAISAGEALDAVLGEPAFATWLEGQPETSWENANLFLQPGGINTGDAIPAVPYWDVELFRTPRNWAIVLVDALDGAILKSDFCNHPCDR